MSAIQHRPGRFELEIEGQACVLDYQRQAAWVDFVHTGVPLALRGRGLAAQLVEAGLQWARSEGLQVRASCSYVAHYLTKAVAAPGPEGGPLR